MTASQKAIHFMDVRRHGFYRVAAVSPIVQVARPQQNAVTHLGWINKAYKKGAQLIVFPELSLNGYTAQDLHQHELMQNETDEAIYFLLSQTENLRAVIVVGGIITVDDMLFNGAYVLSGGKVLGIIVKTNPPNYGEFTEGRWFRKSSELPRNVIKKFYQKEEIPVGDDLIFADADNPLATISGAICESDWAAVPRSTINALKGARILFNLSASNYQVGKSNWREHLMHRSGDNLTAMIYANAGSGESSMGVYFDGESMIADRGQVLIKLPLFEPKGGMIVHDVDLQGISADRQRINTWAENVQMFKDLFPVRWITFSHSEAETQNPEVFGHFERSFDPDPFVPKTAKELENITMARIMGWRKRLEYLPPSLRKIVIGVSGGKDSTSVLMLAVRLVDLFGEQLGMTRQDIVCLTMSGFGTSNETFDYATALGEELGVTFIEQEITGLSNTIFQMIGRPNIREEMIDDKGLKALFGNVQAWVRKLLELSKAAEIGGIVANTSSATELLIGWTTLFGDSAGHYGPNAGLGKSVVPVELIHMAETVYSDQPELRKLMIAIARSASSPENMPISGVAQELEDSEEINGPDRVRDFFAYWMFRFYRLPATIFRLAMEVYEGVYTPQQLYWWLHRFIIRFFQNRYKANMLAIDNIKVGAVAPGSHDFMKYPSDVSPDAWIKALDEGVPAEFKKALRVF